MTAKKEIEETPKRQSNQVALMRSRGYILAKKLSDALGVNHSTVYRWITDGKVKDKKIGRFHYVEIGSLIQHLGADAVLTLGVVTKDEIAAVEKASRQKKGSPSGRVREE